MGEVAWKTHDSYLFFCQCISSMLAEMGNRLGRTGPFLRLRNRVERVQVPVTGGVTSLQSK